MSYVPYDWPTNAKDAVACNSTLTALVESAVGLASKDVSFEMSVAAANCQYSSTNGTVAREARHVWEIVNSYGCESRSFSLARSPRAPLTSPLFPRRHPICHFLHRRGRHLLALDRLPSVPGRQVSPLVVCRCRARRRSSGLRLGHTLHGVAEHHVWVRRTVALAQQEKLPDTRGPPSYVIQLAVLTIAPTLFSAAICAPLRCLYTKVVLSQTTDMVTTRRRSLQHAHGRAGPGPPPSHEAARVSAAFLSPAVRSSMCSHWRKPSQLLHHVHRRRLCYARCVEAGLSLSFTGNLR